MHNPFIQKEISEALPVGNNRAVDNQLRRIAIANGLEDTYERWFLRDVSNKRLSLLETLYRKVTKGDDVFLPLTR